MASLDTGTIDLKELGISTDTTWWDFALQAGMFIAAIFQVACLAFAVYGPESSTKSPKEIQETVSKVRRMLNYCTELILIFNPVCHTPA